uniref:Candidate secreted effector n=1 Tax=Meloidogyne incognita TaxID=6306 RepID=A0A914N508_MELIC
MSKMVDFWVFYQTFFDHQNLRLQQKLGVCIAKSDEKDVVFEDSVEEPFNEQQPSTSNTPS